MTRLRRCVWIVGLVLLLPWAAGLAQSPRQGWQVYAKANHWAAANGGFETGDFSGWTVGGDAPGLTPRVVTSQRHGGSYAAVLGQENAPCE